MKIKCYRSMKFRNYDTYEADAIWGTLEPEEITDQDRQLINSGKMKSMCNFVTADSVCHVVPWDFIISIEEDK